MPPLRLPMRLKPLVEAVLLAMYPAVLIRQRIPLPVVLTRGKAPQKMVVITAVMVVVTAVAVGATQAMVPVHTVRAV